MQPLTRSHRSISQSLNLSIDEILLDDEPMSPLSKGIFIPQLINESSEDQRSDSAQSSSNSIINQNQSFSTPSVSDTSITFKSNQLVSSASGKGNRTNSIHLYPVTLLQKLIGYLLFILWIILVFLFARSVIRTRVPIPMDSNHEL